MERRDFLRVSGAAGLAALLQSVAASARDEEAKAQAQELLDEPLAIDDYYLDPGEMTGDERKALELAFLNQERESAGKAPVRVRGTGSRRAPTYRMLRWQGEIGDPNGQFVGPLSLKPSLPKAVPFQFNTQILNFNTASEDWPNKKGEGTLTVEFRSRVGREPMTWLYASDFDLTGGSNTLGQEYVCQREGMPAPIVTDHPNIDLRFQLMRDMKKRALLRTLLGVARSLLGIPLPVPMAPKQQAVADAVASTIQVPMLVREGVALTQALFGLCADKAPIWRSGFCSFGVAEGGGRIRLTPGLWAVMDGERQKDLRGVVLQDRGGSVVLARNDRPLDLNYLILSVEVAPEPA